MPYCGRIGCLVEISSNGSEELSVEWQIRDVLSLPCGSGDWYVSPQFRIGCERFQLRLWANWHGEILNPSSGFVTLDLDRRDGGQPKTFHFSVGIRGTRGVEKCREGERLFSGFDLCSWNDFCSRSELMEQETRLTPYGILVISCILKSPSAARARFQTRIIPSDRCIGELMEISRIEAEELLVEWWIRHFLALPNGSGDWYMSPEFTIGNERWRLKTWANWNRETWNPASGFVTLDLDRRDGGQPKTFHFSVGIRGSRGVEKNREGEKEFSGFGVCSWNDFCSRSELMENELRLMPDSNLVITCILKRRSAARDSAIREPVAPANISQSSNQQGVSSSASIRNHSEIRDPVASDNGVQSLDKQEQQSSGECVICCTKPIDCAFNSCGHMSCCYKCALEVKEKISRCPICRKSIKSILKLYKSV